MSADRSHNRRVPADRDRESVDLIRPGAAELRGLRHVVPAGTRHYEYVSSAAKVVVSIGAGQDCVATDSDRAHAVKIGRVGSGEFGGLSHVGPATRRLHENISCP